MQSQREHSFCCLRRYRAASSGQHTPTECGEVNDRGTGAFKTCFGPEGLIVSQRLGAEMAYAAGNEREWRRFILQRLLNSFYKQLLNGSCAWTTARRHCPKTY